MGELDSSVMISAPVSVVSFRGGGRRELERD
jgi:hypothetical protein